MLQFYFDKEHSLSLMSQQTEYKASSLSYIINYKMEKIALLLLIIIHGILATGDCISRSEVHDLLAEQEARISQLELVRFALNTFTENLYNQVFTGVKRCQATKYKWLSESLFCCPENRGET